MSQKTVEGQLISFVRSTMEYGATVWNTYLKGEIDKLEQIQNRAIRFIKKDLQEQKSRMGK